MYTDSILILSPDGSSGSAVRLPLGDTQGRNEKWLADLLFANPGAIPIQDLDPSFGPLIPLCRELRTEAGPIDVIFINANGLLTLVECKLWRNPEARRTVVAQALDYARAIKRWSYADLQRQVSAALRKPENRVFAAVEQSNPGLDEHRFIDAVSRAMRSGRFQIIIAGDGIREDVQAITDLVNRNAASAFSFGMIEVALYRFDSSLLIQPRVVVRTVTIERAVVLVRDGGEEAVVEDSEDELGTREASPDAAERRKWWAQLDGLTFDNPQQEPARWVWPNNLSTPMPARGVWLSAYRSKQHGECGVFLSGRSEPLRAATLRLLEEGALVDLPPATVVGRDNSGFIIKRREADFAGVEEEHCWIAETMNAFVNAIRPRLKAQGQRFDSLPPGIDTSRP
jgi:hypothetical protein